MTRTHMGAPGLSGEAAIQNLVLLHYFELCLKDLQSFRRLPSSGSLMALCAGAHL